MGGGGVLSRWEGGLGGVGGWEERVAEEEAAEGVESGEAVFAGCGDIAADAAEVFEGVKAAEGA